jgi:hypothetical protein
MPELKSDDEDSPVCSDKDQLPSMPLRSTDIVSAASVECKRPVLAGSSDSHPVRDTQESSNRPTQHPALSMVGDKFDSPHWLEANHCKGQPMQHSPDKCEREPRGHAQPSRVPREAVKNTRAHSCRQSATQHSPNTSKSEDICVQRVAAPGTLDKPPASHHSRKGRTVANSSYKCRSNTTHPLLAAESARDRKSTR